MTVFSDLMAALLYFESTTSIWGKVKQTGFLLPIAFKDKFDNIAFFGTTILYPNYIKDKINPVFKFRVVLSLKRILEY